ncbi:MAG: hypothetical protein WEE64_14050 [Dehalococcoidia bacterium]
MATTRLRLSRVEQSVYTRFVRRVLPVFAACLLFAASFAACDDEDQGPEASASPPLDNASTIVPVTPIEKPDNVPEPAEATAATTELGHIERRANQEPDTTDVRDLGDAGCEDDVITLETSQETIYLASACDGFWNDEQLDQFIGQEVAIVLEVTEERFRVTIETVPGAQAEFTAAGIWVQ